MGHYITPFRVPEGVIVDASAIRDGIVAYSHGNIIGHGPPPPRDVCDSRVARVHGVVVNNGEPVAGATVQLSLVPGGFSDTDLVRTGADGSFGIVLTTGRFFDPGRIFVVAEWNHMRGRTIVTMAPGEMRDQVRVEVAPAVIVTGKLVDHDGAPVYTPPSPDPHHFEVCLGEDCTLVHDDGSFAVKAIESGSQRFTATYGVAFQSVENVPLDAPPELDPRAPNGSFDNVVLRRVDPSWGR